MDNVRDYFIVSPATLPELGAAAFRAKRLVGLCPRHALHSVEQDGVCPLPCRFCVSDVSLPSLPIANRRKLLQNVC